MIRAARALGLALAAVVGCGGPDVVATSNVARPDGGAPLYCLGSGPPILVGDGITVGEGDGSPDDVCTGAIAVRTFKKALCTCLDYQTSTRLTTDSFDSQQGPYVASAAGKVGPVGINGALLTNDVMSIGGDLTVGARAGLGARLDVAGALAVGAALGTAIAVTVGADARVAGNIELASLTVVGTLTVPAAQTISGTVTGTIVRAPVTIDPPCACQPSDLVDIADFVTSHRVDNEDGLIGLAPTRLDGYTGDVSLELPCGRYFLGPVHGDGVLTIRATGRVALLIDGDLAMTRPLRLELAGAGAELDVMIGGLLSSNSTIIAGDTAHPSRTRIYVGGTGTINLSGDSVFAANLYAPRANLAVSGSATLFGSVFAGSLMQAAPLVIHYDVDVLRANVGCPL